jgi:hypothetical protein
MRPCALVRPAIASAAALLLISCDSHALFGPGKMVSSSEASALATYFPPSEINGAGASAPIPSESGRWASIPTG